MAYTVFVQRVLDPVSPVSWVAFTHGLPASGGDFRQFAATKQAAIAAVDAAVATWLKTLSLRAREQLMNAPEVHTRYIWPDTGSPPDVGATAWAGGTVVGFIVGETKGIKAGILAPGSAPTLISCSPANGPVAGGTQVTLSGTDLATAVSLTIGGVACASLSVINDTTIIATTGPHAAGAVNAIVTLANTSTSAPAALFTYV